MQSKKITKTKLKKLEKREINKKFREWGRLVRERDGDRCAICSLKNGEQYINKLGKVCIVRINAHHIIVREIKELRFDVMNGISLCSTHHEFSREISPHSNAFPFFIWLMRNRPEQFEYLKDKQKDI